MTQLTWQRRAAVEYKAGPVVGRPAPALRLRDRRDQRGAAPRIKDLIRWLAVLVQFPMATGVGIGRIQDRPLEKALIHVLPPPSPRAPAENIRPALNQPLRAAGFAKNLR